MNTNTSTPQVQCQQCNQWHEATYSHEGQHGEGPIYAVVCTVDGLTDWYTTEVVQFPPTDAAASFARVADQLDGATLPEGDSVAWGRPETDPCERGTAGCSVHHVTRDGMCETW